MRPSLLPLLLALVACAFIALSCGDDPEAKTRPDESGSVSDRDRPESDDGPVRPAPSEGIGMADQLSDGVRPVAVQGPGTTADLSSSLQDGTGGGPPYAVPTKGFKAGARYLVRLEPQSTANAACQFMDAKTNVLSVVFTEGTVTKKLDFRIDAAAVKNLRAGKPCDIDVSAGFAGQNATVTAVVQLAKGSVVTRPSIRTAVFKTWK